MPHFVWYPGLTFGLFSAAESPGTVRVPEVMPAMFTSARSAAPP